MYTYKVVRISHAKKKTKVFCYDFLLARVRCKIWSRIIVLTHSCKKWILIATANTLICRRITSFPFWPIEMQQKSHAQACTIHTHISFEIISKLLLLFLIQYLYRLMFWSLAVDASFSIPVPFCYFQFIYLNSFLSFSFLFILYTWVLAISTL